MLKLLIGALVITSGVLYFLDRALRAQENAELLEIERLNAKLVQHEDKTREQ